MLHSHYKAHNKCVWNKQRLEMLLVLIVKAVDGGNGILLFIQQSYYFFVITVWYITLCLLQFPLKKNAWTLLYFETVKVARFRNTMYLHTFGWSTSGKQLNGSVTEWCITALFGCFWCLTRVKLLALIWRLISKFAGRKPDVFVFNEEWWYGATNYI